jgi:hypothetical protein
MSAVERLLEQREHEEFVVLYFLENFQNLLTWHVGLDALARLRAFLGARTVAQWELLTAYWEDVRAWTAENPEGGAPTVAQLRGVKDEQVRLLVWSSARVFANEELVFVHDVVRYQIATGRLLGEPPLR